MHDHAFVPYSASDLALMIILEAICQALSNDTAVLLQRSPENNEKTLLALSNIGYNSQTLLNSGRLMQASNANYFEVSTIFLWY